MDPSLLTYAFHNQHKFSNTKQNEFYLDIQCTCIVFIHVALHVSINSLYSLVPVQQ